jgi:hypothetical protein
MHKHQISVPVFEVVQLSQLKLQEITVFGLNCQRLVINATELFASEWTAVTSHEAETICLPSGLKFVLKTLSVCPVCIKPNTLSSAIDFTHTDMILSANFSPDGKQIVSAKAIIH